MRIAVIGSGVVGLSTAYELAEIATVTVIHDQDLLSSTSALATAVWHVFLIDQEAKNHLSWAETTMQRLNYIHAHDPEAGIELIHGVQVYRTSPEEIPQWSASAVSFAMIPPEIMKKRYPAARFGYEVTTPAVNMSRYLPWLARECTARGVKFEKRHVSSFAELDDYDWIINCTGLRATELTEDPELYPVRGHYIVLEAGDHSPTEYFGDEEREDGMTYVIPRDNEVIVGGTAQEHQHGLEFDIDAEAMIARADEYCQGSLRGLRIKRRVVGLRPCRTSTHVRLERDHGNPKVIHNYGHGGSGFSLAWGSAQEVKSLIQAGNSSPQPDVTRWPRP